MTCVPDLLLWTPEGRSLHHRRWRHVRFASKADMRTLASICPLRAKSQHPVRLIEADLLLAFQCNSGSEVWKSVLRPSARGRRLLRIAAGYCVPLATAASRGAMDLDPANAIAMSATAKIDPKMAFASSHRSNVRRSSADSLL